MKTAFTADLWNGVALASFLIGTGAHTQTALAADGTQLAPVTVAASRGQARVEAMPLNTTIVSQDDIQKSSAQTLDQLLRDVPGMNFTGVPTPQSDPTGHQTRMRGMGNAKVLVLLDGVPIHDPFYLTTQWFKVPLSNIERVEVVRGGNSSLWGNMAVAGVVNIVSKRALNNAGEASVSVGSSGTLSGAVSQNFAVSEALSFNITLDKLNSRGYTTVLADQQWRYPARDPVNTQDTNAQLTAFFRPSRDLQGYVRLGYHVQDQDISYRFGKNLQTNPDISASVVKKLDDKATLTASAWAQYVEFEKYNGATCYWQASAVAAARCPAINNVTQAQVNSQIVQYYTQYGSQRYREQGASIIYSKDWSGVLRSLQVGADYRHLSASDLEFFYSAPQSLTALQSVSSSTYGKAEQTFSGIFAQSRIVPVDPLELTLSARFDSWDNTDRLNTRTTAAGVLSGGPQPATTTTGFNPSLAARYSVSDELGLRAAAYKSFRAQGFNNTTRTFGAGSPTIANPDLAPENLVGREVGVDYKGQAWSVGATWYQYDIENMIATFRVNSYATAPQLVRTICAAGGANLTNCGGSASFYTNDQDGQSYGLELNARWQASKDLSFNAAYTRTTSRLTRKGSVVTDPIGVQLAGVPQDVVNLGVTWKPSAGLQTYLQARYIGVMNIDTTSTAGVQYQQPAVAVLDASLVYQLRKNLDLTLSAVNLFNTEYSENAYTFNQPWSRTLSMPRTVSVGVKARF
jgi:outer membrane receptor protein involved in Fe transport